MKFLVVVLSFSSILAGCTASMQNFKGNSSIGAKIEIEKNYQAVYKDLLEKSRSCYTDTLLTATMYVDGNIYSELGEAEIQVGGGITPLRSIYMVIELRKIEPTKTNVTISFGHSAFKGVADRVKSYILDGSPMC